MLSFYEIRFSNIFRENLYTEHTEFTEIHGNGFLNADFSVFVRVFRVFRVQKMQYHGDSWRARNNLFVIPYSF